MSNAVPILIGLTAAVAIILTVEKVVFPFLAGLSQPKLIPASHEQSLSNVLSYVQIVGESPHLSNDEIARKLTEAGICPADARLLTNLVPSAFTLPVISKMGAKSSSSSFFLYDRNDRPVEFPLACEHYFAVALQIGTDTIEHGYTPDLDQETFTAIVGRSWEMKATNRQLAEHRTVKGWAVGHPCYHDLPSELLISSRKDS